MANPTTKFVSVNLNKSYGRPQTQSSSSSSTSSSRFGNGSRGRQGSVGGGGGMVVLSRTRSSGQKAGGTRLSVPPPLNLPSLRKEHERQDPSSGSGSLTGVGGGAFGVGHGSAGLGWGKPVVQEKDGGGVQSVRSGSGPGNQPVGGLVYAPPVSADQPFVEVGKAAVLRGEDFPSLADASYLSPQKVVSGQRQKQRLAGEEVSNRQTGKTTDVNGCSPPLMRPQMCSSRATSDEKGSNRGNGSDRVLAGSQRNDDGFLTSPLPVVRLMHTSDWADDERDTSHGILDHSREKGLSRNGPGKGYGHSNGKAGNYPGIGSSPSREVCSVDSYERDLSVSGRGGASWRASQFSRDGIISRASGFDRGLPGNYKSSALVRDNIREIGKNGKSPHMDGSWDATSSGTRDPRQLWSDSGNAQTTQMGRNGPGSCNLRNLQRNENAHGRYGDGFNNRNNANDLKKDIFSEVPFGSKGLPLNDPVLNFSRGKHLFSSSGRSNVESGSSHSLDPFSDDINLRVFRRKDTSKQASFHDPVRESFEAELEMVQRMQEEERQRVFEEQTQALELARKKEEERERMAREENERRKRQEDEAREALWREEQERLEASIKTQEAKIAREEEKKRMLAEEGRRKEAARQKLLELEARIARRQAEAAAKDVAPGDTHDAADTCDIQASRELKDGEISRETDNGGWEDGERMVERITSSASSDSSGLYRGFETGSRPNSSKDGNSFFMGRSKHANSWKKDAYDSENISTFQENGYYGQQKDAIGTGRMFPKRGFFGSTEDAAGRISSKEGMSEFHHARGHGWGTIGDSDRYHRNSDFGNAFIENDNYSGAAGWGQSRHYGRPHSPCPDNLFQSSDADSFNSFGRYRHSMRQPRVLPPPSYSFVQKGSFRASPERPSSSAYRANEASDYAANRNDEKSVLGGYQKDQARSWQLGTVSAPQDSVNMGEEPRKYAPQCGSQSSVSVSSPPTSPAHLSHDDLDESQDFHALPASSNGNQIPSSDNPRSMSVSEVGIAEIVTDSSSVSLRDEDEWTMENNDEMQDLEVYDEDGNADKEVQEGGCENFGIALHYEDSQPGKEDRGTEKDQILLCFDEGIEVKIPDEFERSSGGEGKVDKQKFTDTVLDLGSFDGLVNECGTYTNSTFPDATQKSPDTIDCTEKALQNLVIETAISTPASSSSEAFVTREIPLEHQVESASPSQSSLLTHSIISTASTVPAQTNTPVELQFGLFSGPSLIPSPVPAIQIGSIQMPLHLHFPVGQPIPHMQSSQPPFLQFGQLRYPSPMSQGILPLTPQNMPLVQSSVPPVNNVSQNFGGIMHNHVPSHSSIPNIRTKEKIVLNNRKDFDACQGNFEAEKSDLPDDKQVDILENQNQVMSSCDKKQSMENEGAENATTVVSSQLLLGGMTTIQSKTLNTTSTERGKRYVYTVKNAGLRSQYSGMAEASWADRNGLHRKIKRNVRRTEFRVKQSGGKRHGGLNLLDYTSQGGNLDFNRVAGGSVRNVSKKATYVNRSMKSALESQSITSVPSSLQNVIPVCKTTGKEAASKQAMPSVSSFQYRGGSLKSNGIPEKAIDAPLQSGIVQIFKQPGIETPSDEDDFIEVKSKRQMLNVRRKQKEKEIKAKSRPFKASRKHSSVSQSNVVFTSLNKANTFAHNHLLSNSGHLGGDGTHISKCTESTVCSTEMLPQPLLPVGSPLNLRDDAGTMNKIAQASPEVSISSDGSKLVRGLCSGTHACNISTSLGSWNNSHVDQQVVSLTQTQLDDAMKSAEFDTHASSMNNTTSITGDQENMQMSAGAMDKAFSMSTPFNSQISGEKIQFGAITTPTILPPVSRSVPLAIGPPGSASLRSDFSVEHNLTAPEHESAIFFGKKCLDETGTHLEDQDAEAEAAASSVAVAAISNDEVVGNGLAACSVSNSESNDFGGAGVIPSGGSNLMEASSQLAREESLTVTLPADLSVETPSLSSWPTISSSQSSSGPLLSHFPAVPSSHFPFFDVNSMLGGPIFAFGSHDESADTQSQPQGSTMPASGSLGAWPQCHSAVDSHYGPPARFPGPFINPQGGIPGIQTPRQMLFYNPFAPQYGLSIMGTTTFVPPGKQPDWKKHNPVSSVTGASESDTSNCHTVAGQYNSLNIPSQIEHLGQVAPLVPIASHLPVFEMPSVQSSDIPMQARWPHLSGAPLNGVPISVQSEHQDIDCGVFTQAVSHCLPEDSSTCGGRFTGSCIPVPVDGNPAGPVAQFPRELALKERTCSGTSCDLPLGLHHRSSSGNNNDVSRCGGIVNSCEKMTPSSNTSTTKNTGSVTKPQILTPTSASQQHLSSTGRTDHRGRVSSQKAGSSNERNHRTGLPGKSHVLGADNNFSSKVKQVYVAKQPANGTASTVRTKEI